MTNGQCLCGGVRFVIEGELAPIQVCYCSQCRQAQGTPFATNIPVQLSQFRLLQGAELLRAFESSPGKERVFCRVCGSPVYSRKDSLPDVIRVRAGLLQGELDTRPVAHFYVGSKCNWWEIADTLPQFSEAYVPAQKMER